MAAIINQTFRRYSSSWMKIKQQYQTNSIIINFFNLVSNQKKLYLNFKHPNESKAAPIEPFRSFEKQSRLDSLNFLLRPNRRCDRFLIQWCSPLRNGCINWTVLGTYLPWKVKDISDANYICRSKHFSIQNGEMFVWAHPFDLHFKVN